MKKGRGENKDKLPIKKEGRENEKEKKEKEKTTTKRNWKKEYQSFHAWVPYHLPHQLSLSKHAHSSVDRMRLKPQCAYSTNSIHYNYLNGEEFWSIISITSDTQMTPPLWQKVKRNYKASWWKWKWRAMHALITWLIMHWSRGWSCNDHETDHTLITWLCLHWPCGW